MNLEPGTLYNLYKLWGQELTDESVGEAMKVWGPNPTSQQLLAVVIGKLIKTKEIKND